MNEYDRRNLVWLDLCSGLGGASQPALDRGWKVIRVDIDARFKPDIVADVRSLPLKPFHVDVLWASTPCTEYSKWGMRHFYPSPPIPDISLELGVLRAIDRFSPSSWIVENVRAARPWLNPLFGPPYVVSSGHVYWGRPPGLLPQTQPHKIAPHRKFGTDPRAYFKSRGMSAIGTGHMGLTPAEAARIPYEIGEAVCRAVEARRP